jgi:hypothetical protein
MRETYCNPSPLPFATFAFEARGELVFFATDGDEYSAFLFVDPAPGVRAGVNPSNLVHAEISNLSSL